MNPDRFLSLRVNPSRVARVTWVLVVCGLAIIPLAYGVWAGVSLALFAAYLGAYRLLRARASRMPTPSLPETEASFEVRLPKAQLPCLKSATLAMLALSVLACGTALFAPLAAPSLRPDPLELSALTIGLPLFCAAVLLLALAYPFAKYRQEAPLSVGSQNGTVFVTYLLKQIRFRLGQLRVRRVLGVKDDTLCVIQFEDDRRSISIAFRKGQIEEREFFEDFAGWLALKGVEVEVEKQLIPSSVPRLLGMLALMLGMFVTCFGLPQTAIVTGAFWYRWATQGSADFWFLYVWGGMLGVVVGWVVLFASPVGGWLWKLVQGGWRAPKQLRNSVRVIVEERCAGPWRYQSRRGFLRIEDGQLVLSVGDARWGVQRDRVVEVEQLGFRHGLRLGETGRCWIRPTLLRWRGGGKMMHSLALASDQGWSFARDRRLDRELCLALKGWRDGEAKSGFAEMSPGPRRLAPFLALAFLIVGFAIPLSHRHVFTKYVATGRLLPPASIQPKGQLWPHAFDVEALSPGPMLLDENTGTSLWAMSLDHSRMWVGGPIRRRCRVLPIDYHCVPSHPGKLTHVFCSAEMWSPQSSSGLFPAGWFSLPPRLVTLETGQMQPIFLVPRGLLTDSIALYQDKRIFYARRVVRRQKDSPVEIGWIDAEKNIHHPLGEIDAGEPDYGSLVFFPGGRQVLFNWRIIDLDTEERRRVTLPDAHPDEERRSWPTEFNSWPAGLPSRDALRVRIRRDKESTFRTVPGTEVRLPIVIRFQEEVWEIDPALARLDVTCRLPENASLLSADGDRWLLSYPHKEEKGPMLVLYNHDTGSSRTLPNVQPGWHYLVAGKPLLLTWSEAGWAESSISE
jgi:hypothetical protein